MEVRPLEFLKNAYLMLGYRADCKARRAKAAKL